MEQGTGGFQARAKRIFNKLVRSKDGGRYLLLTDVSLSVSDTDNGAFKDLTELCARESPDLDSVRHFILEKAGAEQQKWNMRGCIDCPDSLGGLVLTLRNGSDEELGQMHLTIGQAKRGWRQVLAASTLKGSMSSARLVDRELETTRGIKVRITLTENSIKYRKAADFLCKLGYLAYRRFEGTKNTSDVTEGISLLQRGVELTPQGHPMLASRLSSLGACFHARFSCTGELPDLDNAISRKQKSLEITPDHHLEQAQRMASLGAAYHARFSRLGELSDLDQTISLTRRAVGMTPNGHTDLLHRLTILGASLHTRFDHAGELTDLEEAISLRRKVLELTPDGDPNQPQRLAALGTALHDRFHHLGKPGDLSECISLQQRAMDVTPDDHPNRGDRLFALGGSLYARFRHVGELVDLTEALSLMQRSVEVTPDDHPDLAGRLVGLGAVLYARFQRNGELDDLAKAILLMDKSVEMTSDGHPDLAHRLAILGAFVHARFTRIGQSEDLDKASSLMQRAVELTPSLHPDLPHRVADLGAIFHSRFDRHGELSDLQNAISLKHQALEITPDGHPELVDRLAGLGASLYARFQRTGNLSDIGECISLEQKALDITPEGHPDMAHRLSALAASFHSRFQVTREVADVGEAISLLQRSIQATPDGHPDLAQRLVGLGSSLFARFQYVGNPSDLSECITLQQRALDMTPEGHSDLPHRLSGLGTSFYARFQRTGDPADLDESISQARKSVEVTPDGHPDLPYRLVGLSASLHARFQTSGEMTLLLEAISFGRKALEKTPTNHPDYPATSLSLGNYFASRYSIPDGVPDDISVAISHTKSAAASTSGRQATRLKAAIRWTQLLQLHIPDSPELIQAFDTALSLVAQVADLGQTVQNRYSTLEGGSNVVSDASSAAIKAGRLDKALEWLEQGRCLVWSQLNNLRTPIDELRARDCALAERLSTISRLLDNVGLSRLHSGHGKSLAEKISLEDEARRHHNLVKERDDLITRVRALPGFESFLLPPSLSSLLQGLPPSGYVVVVNAHEDRCDALVLSSGWTEPLHIPLPNFTLKKAKQYRDGLKDSCERYHLRMREGDANSDGVLGHRGIRVARTVKEPMIALLKGLWVDLVKPIYDVLGFKKVDHLSGERYPRIWWCPTGILSFLPIHAAGVYTSTGSECVSALDYAVPSYTPTLSSLTHRVQNPRPTNELIAGLLITSQPSPGRAAPTIPGTTKEADLIYSRVCEDKIRTLKLEGSEVTTEAYLKHMECFSSVHLACHGSQNATDPLSSRFLFHDGSLELRAIIKKDLAHADLAFLSACQTSTGEEKLADEAVHLAAGMLAAGYRRVVATMWSIGDGEAPQVAQDFYNYILDRRDEGSEGGLGGFDGSCSAEALHYAIQQLRSRLDNSDRSLLAWAPYVHWGY